MRTIIRTLDLNRKEFVGIIIDVTTLGLLISLILVLNTVFLKL
jgi:hypothetical protein